LPSSFAPLIRYRGKHLIIFDAPTALIRPLVGIDQKTIEQTLGKPDFIWKKTPDGLKPANGWGYSFSSKSPPDHLGGGQPELTLFFNSKKRVARATCYYAR
jgi:hypothetical protein